MEGYYFVFTSFASVTKHIGHSTRILSLSLNGSILLRIFSVSMRHKTYWSQYPYFEPKPKWKDTTSYLLRLHASQNILVTVPVF